MRLTDNSGNVKEHVHLDDWRNTVGHTDFGYSWTGITMFCKKRHSETVQQHFPTEGAIRQKERKAAGHVSVPRKKFVEQHRDDCGEDLSSIAVLAKPVNEQNDFETLADEVNFHAAGQCFTTVALACLGLVQMNCLHN